MVNFEANTSIRRHWNHALCYEYIMLSNYPRLSDGKLGLSATRLSGGELGLSTTRLSGGKWG